jgi:nicotinamidase-related amidase
MSGEALLIIDMLNDFVLKGAPLEVPDTRKAIPAVQREIDDARRAGTPVIYICDSHAPDDREFERMDWPPHAVAGTSGAGIIKELAPSGDDTIIRKTTYSGFQGTDLDKTLRQLSVDSLRITGCVTHICVLFTAYEAVVKGYDVKVVEDAIAGLAGEDHDAALRIMKNVLGVTLV